MVFVFKFVSPGSDLDGETFPINAATLGEAVDRARAKMRDTFRLASFERVDATSVELVPGCRRPNCREAAEDGGLCWAHVTGRRAAS